MSELKLPPKVSGEKPDIGHMEEFNVNFARFLMRCNEECGELAEFNMGGQQTVLMSGPEAQEAFDHIHRFMQLVENADDTHTASGEAPASVG